MLYDNKKDNKSISNDNNKLIELKNEASEKGDLSIKIKIIEKEFIIIQQRNIELQEIISKLKFQNAYEGKRADTFAKEYNQLIMAITKRYSEDSNSEEKYNSDSSSIKDYKDKKM